jgi:hypothetical protein
MIKSPVTFKAAEKLEKNRLVKIDTSATTAQPAKIVYADKNEAYIGVTEFSGATGDLIAVNMKSTEKVMIVETYLGSAIAVGTDLYNQNDGKFSDATNGGSATAVALQVSAASGDHIQVLEK